MKGVDQVVRVIEWAGPARASSSERGCNIEPNEEEVKGE